MVLSPNYIAESLLFLFVAYVTAFHELDYSDLQALGMTCPPHDTCATPSKPLNTTNCKCDRLCHQYDDCCIDAPRYTRVPPPLMEGLTCFPDFPNPRGVYVVNKCRGDWSGSMLIRRKCDRARDMRDPLVAAPATDVVHNITYRNRYCSECNYVPPENLQSWSIAVECDSLLSLSSAENVTDEYIMEHLVYKTTYPHRNKWGLYFWNPELERQEFFPCLLIFKLPEYLEGHVRYCMPELVTTCSPTWRRSAIRLNCESYTSLVLDETHVFKNPHCAMCNNVNLTSLACPSFLSKRRKPPMSFTLLLDVNLNDGNVVGEVNRCPDGQKYDTFFKKCRKLVCALPGYRMEGGACVKS